ncbi:hypothetical protein CTAYLR_006657 [Chrysophaeum taylorii]|uniref:CS domain-containing protein n=1 Tax=Chrysophaeum taylorii TaxID=2483200 RepID=A0AAD7UEA8_9STRA|nr:hypothetical protein CTAYLR_006657 [Chrysophaeum taylorii]
MLLPLQLAAAIGIRGVSAANCVERLDRGDVAWVAALSPQDLGAIVRSGDVECAKLLVARNLVDDRGAASLFAEAEMALRGAERDLRVDDPQVPSMAISPALEWAQSASAVFLRVKWSHKIDAPATLDVADVRVDCDSGTAIRIEAASSSKTFSVQFPLGDRVDACEWEPASVGRVVVTLAKATRARWPKLTDAPGLALHTWWDKQDSHRKELDALDDRATTRDDDDFREATTTTTTTTTTVSLPTAKRPSLEEVPPLEASATTLSARIFGALDGLRNRTEWAATLSDVIENLLDGWSGDPKAFAARQADRTLGRIRRNATRWHRILDDQAAVRKRRINDELQANITALDESTPPDL